MFSLEEFEIYERYVGGSLSRTSYEWGVGARIKQYFDRTARLGCRELFGDAMLAAADALRIVEEVGSTGLALEHARKNFDEAKAAIDAHWRTVAFEGCRLRQSGALTLVELEGDAFCLFAERLADLQSATTEIACERGRFLEAGAPAVDEARRDYFRAYRHFGHDDRSIKGMDAHDLVAEAVQRGLLDWEDAEWWWPWQFPERCPARAGLNLLSDDPFATSDADA